jgi:CRISPR-associated protein Cas2
MLYLISYDIPSDKPGDRRRARLAKFLLGRGLRVQWSVFEVMLSPERLPALIEELEELIDPDADSVRIYPLCAACTGRVNRLGVEAVVEREGLLVW